MPTETCPFGCGSELAEERGPADAPFLIYECGSAIVPWNKTKRVKADTCRALIAERKLHALREAVEPFIELAKQCPPSPRYGQWAQLAKAYEESEP